MDLKYDFSSLLWYVMGFCIIMQGSYGFNSLKEKVYVNVFESIVVRYSAIALFHTILFLVPIYVYCESYDMYIVPDLTLMLASKYDR